MDIKQLTPSQMRMLELMQETEAEKEKYIDILSKGSKVLNISKPYKGNNGNKKVYIKLQ